MRAGNVEPKRRRRRGAPWMFRSTLGSGAGVAVRAAGNRIVTQPPDTAVTAATAATAWTSSTMALTARAAGSSAIAAFARADARRRSAGRR